MKLVKRIGLRLIVALFLAAITTTTFKAFSSPNLIDQGTEIQLPVNVYQLQTENGEMPLLLQCGDASVTTPNRLNGFSCTLLNNTDKNLIAAQAAYTIEYEEGGRTYREVRSHLAATYVHPDFSEDAKSVPRGGTITIKPGGSFTYENAVIKGVGITIDYVEFSDGSSIGPNKEAASAVRDLREGASRYKSWLVQKYNRGSIDTVIQLLQIGPPLSKLSLTNGYLEQGANLYRKRLQNIEKTRGRSAVQRYLSR